MEGIACFIAFRYKILWWVGWKAVLNCITVGSDWELERQHHQGACEPCCVCGERLDCAGVGGQGEVGSRNGLCEGRVEGTLERDEMYGRHIWILGPSREGSTTILKFQCL